MVIVAILINSGYEIVDLLVKLPVLMRKKKNNEWKNAPEE